MSTNARRSTRVQQQVPVTSAIQRGARTGATTRWADTRVGVRVDSYSLRTVGRVSVGFVNPRSDRSIDPWVVHWHQTAHVECRILWNHAVGVTTAHMKLLSFLLAVQTLPSPCNEAAW